MVAYSFQKRFVEPILGGSKGGTIRADRRRHARPGEELQLYTGMRTKQCRMIARKRCVTVEPIILDFGFPRISTGCGWIVAPHRLDVLAQFDGFIDFEEMAVFWETKHGAVRFTGQHIRWLPLP